MDNKHTAGLRQAYDFDAPRRDTNVFEGWRRNIVDEFLDHLAPGATVLELGAGAGQAAVYVAGRGYPVIAMDLSPANVANAIARGIDARTGDFTNSTFHVGRFDGVFALNSLIHVPKPMFPQALQVAHRSLRTGGIALIVNWGGYNHEGFLDDEWTEPPRFFAFYSDEDFALLPTPGFGILQRVILTEGEEADLHPQVLLLEAH